MSLLTRLTALALIAIIIAPTFLAVAQARPLAKTMATSEKKPVKIPTLDEWLKEADDRFIVVYKPGTLKSSIKVKAIDAAHKRLGVKLVSRLKHLDMDIIKPPEKLLKKGLATVLKELREKYARLVGKDFVGVYPDLKYYIGGVNEDEFPKLLKVLKPEEGAAPGKATVKLTPFPGNITLNDQLADYLWNLKAINATIVWSKYTMGKPTVVIAVVDTGILPHPDILQNIWINPGEILNGKDDDGNGYVDDIFGWDTGNDDPWPWDTYGHGTGVSGVIAAVANNTLGVAGVAPLVKILAVKASPDYAGYLYTSDILEAFEYIITMKKKGVNIVAVSASWGAEFIGPPLWWVIKYIDYPLFYGIYVLGQYGIIFVNAAGNAGEYMDDDLVQATPAEYTKYLPNLISVGAYGPDVYYPTVYDNMTYYPTWFSNYGYTSVDIYAPGTAVLTLYGEAYYTYTGSGFYAYAWWAGTSFSTPHTSATVALMYSAADTIPKTMADAALIKYLLMVSAAPYPEGVPKWAGKGGYLDAEAAVRYYKAAVNGYVPLKPILISPRPYYPGYTMKIVGGFWGDYVYERTAPMKTADILPAKSEVEFRVFGPPGRVDYYLVYINDEPAGKLVEAEPGIYVGKVRIPEIPNATKEIVNVTVKIVPVVGGDEVSSEASEYTFQILTKSEVYKVEIPDEFIWVDPETLAGPFILKRDTWYWYPAYETMPTPPTVNGGFNLSLAELKNLVLYQPWDLLQWLHIAGGVIIKSEYCMIQDYVYPPTECWIEGLYSGVTTRFSTLSIAALGDNPILEWPSPYYFAGTVRVGLTELDGVPALVYYFDYTKYPVIVQTEYGLETKVYPATFEVIVLANGTIIVSYLEAPAEPDLAAHVTATKYLTVKVPLKYIANVTTGMVERKTIKFTPVTPVLPTVYEAGVVTVDHRPVTVEFKNVYKKPVVVVGPPTWKGWQPCVAVAYDITSEGFKVRLVEFPYLDGVHVKENVSYLVIEEGVGSIGGLKVEAGYAEASTTKWVWVPFPEPFEKTPVVIASLASETIAPDGTKNFTALAIRIKGVNTTGFWILLQPEEKDVGKVKLEAKVAWVAVEPGETSTIEAGFAEVGTKPVKVSSALAKPGVPVLASIDSFKGPDTVIPRIKEVGNGYFSIALQEEQSKDSETGHVTELVGYLVIKPPE